MQKNRLKIAIVDHSPDLGGAEVTLLTLLKNIDRSRFDATVILPSRGAFSEALERIHIPVLIIPLPMRLIRLKRGRAFHSFLVLCASFFFLQFFFLRLCLYLRRNRVHLVLTNTIKAHLYGSLAARLWSIPLVWRFHDILEPSDFSPLLIRFVAFFGRLFPKKILAVSGVTQCYLVKSGVHSPKTEVIFNAIDPDLFEKEGDGKDIRAEYGLGDGVKLVGCVGRIIPQKGQRVLLAAIPQVVERYPDTFFLIVGDIFLNEDAYRKELLETIKKNGIEERVGLTGFRRDIRNVMATLDMVVFPSVAPEAFPLSVLEAMSLGKSVIASDTGGVREMIEDGVSGFLVEPNRPEQIAERIIYLLQRQDIAHGIGKNAKERVAQEFSLRNFVTSMERACSTAVVKE
jgi:glycosyltransferase involved in cell wall biosynthesis